MIRSVLGSRASIGDVLGSGRGGAAAWWLSGGVSAANAIAVYQPIGAASLAASYTNLANPGTYTAAPGVAPTFDTATGWTFAAASTQYLNTGIIPASGWSMILRYSNAASLAFQVFAGSQKTPGNYRFYLGATTASRYFGSGGTLAGGTFAASGVLCVAGQAGYYNGAADGIISTGWDGATDVALIIGANRTSAFIVGNYASAQIQAFAIFNTTLTAPQVAAISSAMSLL